LSEFYPPSQPSRIYHRDFMPLAQAVGLKALDPDSFAHTAL
jgi:hypothetical protein